MKKVYITVIAFSFIFLAGCSKDVLKSYEHRIVGTWRITDVNRIGLGGNTDNLPFKQGIFNFNDDGSLVYTNISGDVYKGSWDIRKKRVDDKQVQSLQITAVDFVSQNVLTEYYDDLNFTGTNRFKATITSGSHAYITHFRR
ncbi:MAG: hypothetical protein ABIO81_11680 [Ginsengibacter sp.]